MKLIRTIFHFAILIILGVANLSPANAQPADWFCTEGASERSSNHILACGIARHVDEDQARKAALLNAFDELDLVCDRSADCSSFELNIEPKRNECRKEPEGYKCYRAVMATITSERRNMEFRKGHTLKPQMETLERTVNNSLPKACSVDTRPVEKALANLSTPAQITLLVEEAVKVPFAGACFKTHATILAQLRRYKIQTEAYQEYLLGQIVAPNYPGPEESLELVLDYISVLGPAADKQWPIIFQALKISNTGRFYRSLPLALKVSSNVSGDNKDVLFARLEQILDSMRDKEFGRPVPISFDHALAAILRAISDSHLAIQTDLTLYVTEKYLKYAQAGTSTVRIHGYLFDAFKEAENEKQRHALLQWAVNNISQAPPSKAIGKEIVETFEWFDSQVAKLDDEEAADRVKIKRYVDEKTMLKKMMTGKVEESLAIVDRDREFDVKRRVIFCVKNGFTCPNIMPSQEDLHNQLTSKRQKKREDALDLLRNWPDMRNSLEADIIQTLIDVRDPSYDFNAMLLRQVIDVLADIPTRNPRALDAILDEAFRGMLNYPVIIKKLGSPVVAPIVKAVSEPNHRQRKMAIELLGILGQDAREAIPVIEAQLKTEKSESIREVLLDSLKKIKR